MLNPPLTNHVAYLVPAPYWWTSCIAAVRAARALHVRHIVGLTTAKRPLDGAVAQHLKWRVAWREIMWIGNGSCNSDHTWVESGCCSSRSLMHANAHAHAHGDTFGLLLQAHSCHVYPTAARLSAWGPEGLFLFLKSCSHSAAAASDLWISQISVNRERMMWHVHGQIHTFISYRRLF